MSELAQRLLTAAVLGGVVLGLIIQAPTAWFAYFLVGVALISLYEFGRLVALKPFHQLLVIALVAAVLTLASSKIAEFYYHNLSVLTLLFLPVILFWLKNMALVLQYPNKKPKHHPAFHAINGVLWLTPLLGLAVLNNEHKDFLLWLLLIVVSADSCAYFVGKAFGKHKLAPQLSSGKTIEGVMGGLLGAVLATFAWMWVSNNVAWQFPLIALISAACSVVGDLYESIYKREAGVKHSGAILPGHGGVLDRIDGLLAATPIFLMGTMLL